MATAAAATAACVWLSCSGLLTAAPLTVRRADGDRHVEILDGDKPVLRYNFQTVPVPKGVKGKYAVARSDYIHPLYGPAGEVLTKDFSPDHPHHRGLYWAWPEVYYKGKKYDLHALQGVFARPEKILRAESGPASATIVAASKWMWDDTEPIVREVTTIRASRHAGGGRIVDLTFAFTALVDGVSVARRGQRAYGGFNLRFSPRKNQKILPHTDPPSAKLRRAWAQLVGVPPGGKGPVSVAIIQHRENPYYPGDWVSYPNLSWLQPTFPAKGVKHPLSKDKPLVLRFRLLVQSGAADKEMLRKLWADFHAGPTDQAGPRKVRLLPPGRGNPRNSEGDFIQLKDGRILFVYTHFTGGGADHSAAYLAGRMSTDGGQTWTKADTVVVPNEGKQNVMSASLLRLRSGKIALFYLRKNSLADCRPYLRISTDEAKTWSAARLCIQPVGYNVLNNDRAVQLNTGRIILPVSRHGGPGQKWSGAGEISCWLSDDRGKTWRQSRTVLNPRTAPRRVVLQEPGVVALKDGRLMMFMRTTMGSQYLSYSTDRGETWSPAKPSAIRSPCSPATIERIPATGDLLMVWNDHSKIAPSLRGKRTPLTVAISRDEAKTWRNVQTLEGDPGGWYCYTAMDFVADRILLAHCAGQRKTGGLNLTQITSFDVAWLYR